jgi:hypothetical protein
MSSIRTQILNIYITLNEAMFYSSVLQATFILQSKSKQVFNVHLRTISCLYKYIHQEKPGTQLSKLMKFSI